MMQQYLIFYKGEMFLTKWFDIGNNFVPGMIAIDTYSHKYFDDTCTDGQWKEINQDHL